MSAHVQTLLPLTGVPVAGAIAAFSSADNIRVYQVNPRPGVPFTGALEIQESYVASPGASDFQRVASITFTAHATNFSLEIESDAPWTRVVLISASVGEIAVFGSSRSGLLQGGKGASTISATAIVDGAKKAGVTGPNVGILSPTVAQFTSDNVQYATNINKTVTDILDDFVAFDGALTTSGTSAADLAVLAGVDAGGLTNAKMLDIAQYQPSVSEINFSVGVTSGVQTQLDALTANKAIGAGVDITGLVVDPLWMNGFFDTDPVAAGVAVSTIATSLGGLVSTSADLNVLNGVGGAVLPDIAPVAADFWKLAAITATALEISTLSGFTGTSTDLNKIALITASAADLSAFAGIAGTGVTTTELTLLSGLTENVQVALNNIPDLTGLVASVADMNILNGAATGTGAFSGGPITSNEVAYLDGLTGNIQAQIDTKRDTGVDIGIGEISGAAITTIELNYLQGTTSNIQAQLDGLILGSVTVGGGDVFTAPFFMSDGSVAAPGLGFASQTTSGFYLEGVGIGFSTSGVRVGNFTGTNLELGDSGTNGQPTIRFSGMGIANPAYSFVGDTNSGITRVAAGSVGVIANGEIMVEADKTAAKVTLGGLSASNNAVDVTGIAGFEKVLGSVAVDGRAVADTPIYQVPVGRTAVVTKILVIITNSDATGPQVDIFRMNIGTSGTFDQIVDNVGNINIFGNALGYDFVTSGQVMALGMGSNAFSAIGGAGGASYGIMAAAATLTASVSTPSTAVTNYDLQVVAFGYEY